MGERYILTTGRVHAMPTHPKDRHTGHHFAFIVDCPLPTAAQSEPSRISEFHLAVTMQAGSMRVDTVDGKSEETPIIVGNGDIPVTVTRSGQQHAEFTVCLSPLSYRADNAPLVQLMEWRQYMADIGVDRVSWYGREASLGKIVDLYKRHTGAQDTYQYVSPSFCTRSALNNQQTCPALDMASAKRENGDLGAL